jgi:ribose-phosphate pyrophosphokinase
MDVFLVQSASDPVNKNIMELLIMLDALKRASAYRVTAVLPYYGYARQDRKDQPRVPITAKLVADLIATAGAHRVLTIDLHAGQIQGFFNIPVDHLYATPVLLDHFRQVGFDDLVVVSPDAGGVERARAFAKRLKASLAIIDKRRKAPTRPK